MTAGVRKTPRRGTHASTRQACATRPHHRAREGASFTRSSDPYSFRTFQSPREGIAAGQTAFAEEPDVGPEWANRARLAARLRTRKGCREMRQRRKGVWAPLPARKRELEGLRPVRRKHVAEVGRRRLTSNTLAVVPSKKAHHASERGSSPGRSSAETSTLSSSEETSARRSAVLRWAGSGADPGWRESATRRSPRRESGAAVAGPGPRPPDPTKGPFRGKVSRSHDASLLHGGGEQGDLGPRLRFTTDLVDRRAEGDTDARGSMAENVVGTRRPWSGPGESPPDDRVPSHPPKRSRAS